MVTKHGSRVCRALNARLHSPQHSQSLHQYPHHHSHLNLTLRNRGYATVASSVAQQELKNPTFKIDLPRLNGHGPFAEKPSFEVIGSPFSLLSARIPSKAILYTRRGSLVGVNGEVGSITSTLSAFNSGGVGATLTSAVTGAPFLYQKLQGAQAFTALIGTRASATSFAVLELDGRFDWNVISKNALLAWCGIVAQNKAHGVGQALSRVSTNLTGRGVAVVAGNGQIYQIVLQQGESYILNPANVLAYAESCPEPQRINLSAGSVRLTLPVKLPSLSAFLLKYEFFRVMAAQPFWRITKKTVHSMRRFFSNLVWGEQLLIRFEGPTTILIESRTSSRYTEERGPAEMDPVTDNQNSEDGASTAKTYSGSLKLASIQDGKVVLHDTDSFVR